MSYDISRVFFNITVECNSIYTHEKKKFADTASMDDSIFEKFQMRNNK